MCGALPALAPLRRVRRIFTVVPPQELGNPASSIKLIHAAYPANARWAVSTALCLARVWDMVMVRFVVRVRVTVGTGERYLQAQHQLMP